MKKQLLLLCGLFTAVTLCFPACNDDDDDEQDGSSKKNEMVGKLYAEPCLDFHACQDTIKTFMTGFDLIVETEDKLIYDGKYKEETTVYNFEDNCLEDISIGFDETISINTLHNALKSKYKYEGEMTTGAGTGIKYYSHPEKEVAIGLLMNMTNSLIINVVVYIDNQGSSNKPAGRNTAGMQEPGSAGRNIPGTTEQSSLAGRMAAAAGRLTANGK